MMRNILYIGNHGSFSNEAVIYYSSYFNTTVHLLENYNDENAISKELGDLMRSNDFDLVFYFGGEVYDEQHMDYANDVLPRIVFEICKKKHTYFCYLSSLASYGYHSTGLIDVHTIPKSPLSRYATSKRSFDDYVKFHDANRPLSLRIYPASIAGSKRGTSALENMIKVASRFTLLRYARFSGIISFVHRAELFCAIRDLIERSETGDYFVVHNVEINVVLDYVYGSRFSIDVTGLVLFLIKIKRIFGKPMSTTLNNVINSPLYADFRDEDILMDVSRLTQYVSKYSIT